MNVGTKVIVYDRYQQAVPVSGEVIEVREAHPPGVKVRLHTSNSPLKPIGTEEWFFAEQLREAATEIDVLRVENRILKEKLAGREDLSERLDALAKDRDRLGDDRNKWHNNYGVAFKEIEYLRGKLNEVRRALGTVGTAPSLEEP